jgi:thiamine-monophosphate kinase
MLNSILENNFVNTLTAKFSRSPMQKNLLHESDAEIIKLSEDSETCIAITIDSISEEIEAGLYDDPYLMGWMIVMVNISDLAAVAATPLGLLISEILPENLGKEFLKKLQKGIADAAEACNVFILGGDTNFGKNIVLTGCALGRSSDNKYLKRKGCKPGDILYSTNKPGIGNAFAISKLLSKNSKGVNYFPFARIKEASILSNFASCCMDTSDGIISTLDQLMRLNNFGFRLIPDWERKLNHESFQIAEKNKIPFWLLLAGEHGEFELLFTIPQKVEKEFLRSAEKENWIPVKLGKVIQKPEIQIDIYNKTVTFNSQKIRNLPFEYRGDIKEYLKSMLIYDRELFNSKV